MHFSTNLNERIKECKKKKKEKVCHFAHHFPFSWQRGLNGAALQQICATPLIHLESSWEIDLGG